LKFLPTARPVLLERASRLPSVATISSVLSWNAHSTRSARTWFPGRSGEHGLLIMRLMCSAGILKYLIFEIGTRIFLFRRAYHPEPGFGRGNMDFIKAVRGKGYVVGAGEAVQDIRKFLKRNGYTAF